jgi:hypothetical protein
VGALQSDHPGLGEVQRKQVDNPSFHFPRLRSFVNSTGHSTAANSASERSDPISFSDSQERVIRWGHARSQYGSDLA